MTDGGSEFRGRARVIETRLVEAAPWGDTSAEKLLGLQTAVYNPGGQVIEESFFDAGGSLQSRSVSTRDAEGRLLEVECYGADGALSGRTVYSYDEAGRGVEKIFRTPDGLAGERTVTAYDSSGQREDFITLGDSEAEWYTISGTVYRVPGARSIRVRYGPRQEIAGALFYDSRGEVVSNVSLIYDDAGRLIEEAQYFGAGPPDEGPRRGRVPAAIPHFRRTHEYDSEGRSVEDALYVLGSLESRRRFTYDRDGNLTAELEYSAGGAVRRRIRFSYDFNRAGDWTKKVASDWAADTGEYIPARITYRTIEYY